MHKQRTIALLLSLIMLITMCQVPAVAASDTNNPLINPISSSAGSTFEEGTKTTFSTAASDDVALDLIEMYIDGDDVKTVNAYGTSGSISYSTSSLDVGKHTITVKAWDTSGNMNQTSINVTVTEVEKDTTQPLINPITSSAGSTFEEGTKTTFSTKATDNVELDEIEMLIDGESVKTVSASGSTSKTISYSTDDLDVGKHTITVKAWDAAGNMNQTAINVTVTEPEDTTQPLINPITSSAGSTFEEGTETTFSTKATDDVELDEIEMLIDGESVKTVSTSSTSKTISYTTDELEVGKHTITVKAWDAAGNMNQTAINVTVTEPKDTTQPLINPITSSAGSTFEAGTETTFSTKATDNVELDEIEMLIDGESVESVTTSATSKTISYTTSTLSVGTHTITVKAWDAAGNMNQTAINVTVTKPKDTTQPLINPITSSAGSTFEEGTETTFSTKATDNVELDEIEMLIDGESVKTVTASGSTSKTISYTTSDLAVGTHTVTVKAYDAAGNMNQTAINVVVTAKPEEDTAQPLINPITSSAGSTFVEGTETTFTTKVSDNAVLAKIEMYIGSELVKTVNHNDTTPEAIYITHTTSALAVGTHTVTVKAYDAAGNMNQTAISITVTEYVNKVPTISTDAATAISTTSATLNGTLIDDYGFSVTEWGFYWSTNALDFPIENGYTSNDLIAVGADATHTLNNLTPNTTYYYYFYAVNSEGESVRDVKEFTTLNDQPVAPVAVTMPVGTITANSAILNGKITSDGGSAVTEWGYAWKESGDLDYHAERFITSIAVNEDKAWTLSGLEANTEYEYYFYAVNSEGEHEGTVVKFTTLLNGAYLNVSGNTSFIAYEGSAKGTPINVSSNMPWTATSDVPWITLNADVANGILYHSYAQNCEPDERVGKITISAAGCTDVVLTVTQKAYAKAEIIGGKPVLDRANGSNGQNSDKFTLTVITNAATTRLSAVNNNKDPYPLNPNAFKCYPQQNGQKKWIATYTADMPHSDRFWTVTPYNEVGVAGASMESTHISIACSHNYLEVSRSEIYRYYDEVEHIMITTINKKCSWCGKEVAETRESDYRAAHMYENGKCVANGCNAQYTEPAKQELYIHIEDEYYSSIQDRLIMTYGGGNVEASIADKATGTVYHLASFGQYKLKLTNETNNVVRLNGCTLSVLEDKTNGTATLSLVDTQTNDIVDSVSIWVPALYNEWGTTVTTGTVSMEMIEDINHDQKFYGREGVYIDKTDDVQIFNFTSEYRNDQTGKFPEGYYRITFDAYNSMPIVYGVRVYDENMSYIKGSTVLIQGYSANYSAWRIATGMLSDLADDVADGKMGYITGESSLEKKVTNVSLDVPLGGYIKFAEMTYEDDDNDGENDNIDVRWANYAELMIRVISTPDVMAKLKIPKPSANGVVDMGTFVASLQTPMMKVHTEALIQDIIKSCAGKNALQAVSTITGLLSKAEYAECVEHIKQALQASIIEVPKAMGEEFLNTAEDALLLAAKPLYIMTNAGDAGGNVAEIAIMLKAISDVDDVEYLQMVWVATPSSAE